MMGTDIVVSPDKKTDGEKLCRLCPRKCGVDRAGGKKGVCGVTGEILVTRASLHMWEEPCITGERGSGTVFFAGCPLHCVYCQNESISHAGKGRVLSVAQLVEVFLLLEKKGAENINLVTPTHYSDQIREAIRLARRQGLTVPMVYNCSGYESVETLQMLDGLVDVYLTDFKYMEKEPAVRYSHAEDYPERAAEALEEMVRQCPESLFDERGMMHKGVILRHLLLPGYGENGKKVLDHAFSRYGNRIWYSLMNQYTPMPGIRERFPELGRKVEEREYDELVDYALELGVENGFIQEGDTAEDSFIPDFDEMGFLAEIH